MRRYMWTGPALVLATLALGSTQAAACDWDDCDDCGTYGYYAAPAYSYYAPPAYYARPAYAAYAPVYYAPPAYYAAPAYYAPPPAYAPPAYGYRGYSRPYYGYGGRPGNVDAANTDPRTAKYLAASNHGGRGIVAAASKHNNGARDRALAAANGAPGLLPYAGYRAAPGSRAFVGKPAAGPRMNAAAAKPPSQAGIKPLTPAKAPRAAATITANRGQPAIMPTAPRNSGQGGHVSTAYVGPPR